MKELLQLIERALKSNKMTVSELSRKANVSRQHIYSIMSGDHAPGVDVAERLAKALGYKLTIKTPSKPSKRKKPA